MLEVGRENGLEEGRERLGVESENGGAKRE